MKPKKSKQRQPIKSLLALFRALLTTCSLPCNQDFHRQQTQQQRKPSLILLFVEQHSLRNLIQTRQRSHVTDAAIDSVQSSSLPGTSAAYEIGNGLDSYSFDS